MTFVYIVSTTAMYISENFRIAKKKILYVLTFLSVVVCVNFIWISFYMNFYISTKKMPRELAEQLPKSDYDPRWTWECKNKICEMERYRYGKQTSLRKCNMMCSKLQLWPMPKSTKQFRKKYLSFYKEQLNLESNAYRYDAGKYIAKAFDIFVNNVEMLLQNTSKNRTNINSLRVKITLEDVDTTALSMYFKESYILIVQKEGADLVASITASNFVGARHGLETLSQLIWFDNVDNLLNIIYDVKIKDEPSFPYRGLMVDTARNYFPVSLLAKVIDGMAANKLNVFHWHITDAQSFPFAAPNFKFLAKYGSYGPEMVYDVHDIKYIIEYAKIRGIRVLIEVDAPSHTLKGWKDIGVDMVFSDNTSINGQLNPDHPKVLSILKEIYREILSLMIDDEFFHIGGDEVRLNLWEDLIAANPNIDINDYWASFMQKIIDILKSANNGKSPDNIILWSSPFINNFNFKKIFNVNRTIVQYWYGDLNEELIYEGLRIIYSNVKYWYLDCGFGKWQEGNRPSCEPYRTWQTIYKATPWDNLKELDNVLGGEICMWTEQVGEDSLETRIWPRSAAFAERLWSNPSTTENLHHSVYTRLDTQRERMSTRNIKSEVLWPKYCSMNPNKC